MSKAPLLATFLELWPFLAGEFRGLWLVSVAWTLTGLTVRIGMMTGSGVMTTEVRMTTGFGLTAEFRMTAGFGMMTKFGVVARFVVIILWGIKGLKAYVWESGRGQGWDAAVKPG
jgi:hypothetical protein